MYVFVDGGGRWEMPSSDAVAYIGLALTHFEGGKSSKVFNICSRHKGLIYT